MVATVVSQTHSSPHFPSSAGEQENVASGEFCRRVRKMSVLFENFSRKMQVLLKSEKIPGTLHEDLRAFMTKSRSILLKMRHVSDKIKTQIWYDITPPPENRAAYVIMGTIMVELDGPQMTIRRMRFPCRTTKTTDTHTHTEYGIFIAFPLQKWLHERASMLLYT